MADKTRNITKNGTEKSIKIIPFLGTLNNENENGVIAFADQIYDSTGKQSVEARITAVKAIADQATTDLSALKTSVGNINQFEYVVAGYLPTASADTMYKIYLVPTGVTTAEGTAEPTIEPGRSTANIKDEYITVKQGDLYYWEKLGTTEVDLSAYAKSSAVTAAINGLDSEQSGAGTHVTVKVTETGGKISAVAVTESDIASANTLTSVKSTADAAKTAAANAQEAADGKIASVSGTAGDYIDPGVSTDANHAVAIKPTLTVQAVGTASTDAKGLAEASDVKTFVEGKGYQTAAQVKATKVDNAAKADTATSAGSATKATQDGDGNVISSTYAKATDVSATYLTAETVGSTTYDETSIDKVLNK